MSEDPPRIDDLLAELHEADDWPDEVELAYEEAERHREEVEDAYQRGLEFGYWLGRRCGPQPELN